MLCSIWVSILVMPLRFLTENGLGICLAGFSRDNPLQREAEDGNPAVPCERRNLNDRENLQIASLSVNTLPQSLQVAMAPYALAGGSDDSVIAVG